MTKQCTKCLEEKILKEFHSGKDKFKKHCWCKICSKVYNHNRYMNKGSTRRLCSVKRRKVLQQWLREYKIGLSCSCGESHPACLDFHHKDPSMKIDNIGNLASRGWSIKNILKEINKCDVVCANCHRKLEWNKKQRI